MHILSQKRPKVEDVSFLKEENNKLKSQLQNNYKHCIISCLIVFIFSYLILPSPIALLFPKPVQGALKNISCSTNAMYQKLGI